MSVPDFAARPQLSEDVARYVRKRIFDGTYSAGEYVRLDQLAAELGISVTPVREALFELRAEGLLAQQPRRGFVVLPVTGRDLADVANVQAHVGGELAARAATNIDDDQLRELKEIQAQLEEAYAGDDDRTNGSAQPRIPPRHQRCRRLAEAGTGDVPDHPLRTGIGISRPSRGWPDQSIKDHRRVVAALAKRDGELARKAMSEHLAAGAAPLIDHLAENGVVDGGDCLPRRRPRHQPRS